jgi:predicted permease
MNWFKQAATRGKIYDDLAEEMRLHLEEKTERLMEAGLSHDEAESKAKREFGNTTLIEERSREVWQRPTLESIWADIKYAGRQLRKSPGFTFVCILTIALGVGANTAVFSVIDAVILRPLPYAQAARLVNVQSTNSQHLGGTALSYPDFFDWRAHNHTLEHLVSYHDTSYTLTGLDRPIPIDAEVVSWDLLAALRVAPEIGRGFAADEEKQGVKVALISHSLWVSQFNSDKSITGRPINLNGSKFTVIGVMPATFRFPVTAPQNGIWTTLAVDDDPSDPHSDMKNRGSHSLSAIGRMKTGVTVRQVDQDLKRIAGNLAKQYPDTNAHRDAARVQTELASIIGKTRTELMVVLGAVGLVLLIACGNIASLLLARMRDRQREIALRAALGADRKRIIRQLLIESLVLSATGGLVGCGFAFACTPAILSLIGDSIPRAADARIDLRVLLFTLVVSCAAGLVFGIIPALTASKTELVSTLKEGARADISGRDWLRSSLIVGQIALGLVLTAAAGLLIASFLNLRRTDEGFNPDHLLTFLFELPDFQYRNAQTGFYQRYFERLRALPGVQSAAGVLTLPMTDDGNTLSFDDPEHPTQVGQSPKAYVTTITPEYFRTMQIPLLKGRDFSNRDDTKSPPVVIVNQAFVQRYFSGKDALRKKLTLDAGNGPPEIVGVVGNIRLGATQQETDPMMYLSAAQQSQWCCLYTVLRTAVEPRSMESTARQLVTSMDANLPIIKVNTMQELMFSQLSQPRFAMILLGTFAGLAIILTVVGLYGVMTYSVSRRTREIGIRMALGAQRSSVLSMILGDAAILLASGIVIGLTVSLASTSILQSMLYGTEARNPVVLVSVAITVALSGFIAAYFPALRAASINPTQALRGE